MAICKGILLLLVTVAISTVSCDSSYSPSDSNEILRNIIVTDSNVLLGSSDGLYRLSLDLQQQQRRQLDTPNRLLVTDPNGTYAESVFTCGTSTCSLSNIQDLSDIRWQVSSGVVGPDIENIAGIFAPGPNGTSSLTFGQREHSVNIFAVDTSSSIKKGDLISVNSPGNDSFGAFAQQDENDNLRERRFLATFSYKNYVYFVTTLQLSADEVEIRVFRFCHEDQGITGPIPLFASRYEIVLQCSPEDVNDIVGYSATFVESVEPFGTESILLGVVGTAMNDHIVNYACNYSLDEINRQINKTLDACLGGPGENDENVIGFAREDDGIVVLCRAATVTVKECSLFGPLSAGLEVKHPLTETAFLYDMDTGKAFTSVVYTSVDGYSFLFAGTNEGTLHQFYIQSPTEATKVRDITLDASSEVTKLLASNNGETIYALTSKKLFQHPVDVCDMFTTCDECITSPDPICGWCTLQRSCTRSLNCMEGDWVNGDDSGSCPAIQSATPPTIYFSQLIQSDVIVSLSISNIQTELDYACIFDFANTAPLVTSTVSQNTTHVQCLAPAEDVIPPIPAGEDTVASTVSLRYEVTDIVTLQDAVGFANCAVHTSCTSCINSRQGCEWCPFTFHCIDPLEDAMCNGNNEDSVLGGCPLIRSPEDHENYLIHVNIPQSLVIQSENLDTLSSGHLSCELLNDEGEVLFNSSAELAMDGVSVHCMEDQFNFNLSEPKLETTLKILWKDQPIDNPNNTGVTLYSCGSLGTNCAQCLSIPAEFNCHYCLPSITQCMYEDECSEQTIAGVENVDMCSNPVIEGFWPTAGPIDGGTNITITGTNLGAEQSDIVYIRIDGVNCTLTSYEPGVQMNCTTLGQDGHIPAPEPITVKLNYIEDEISSTENFEFKIPQLANPPADPMFGPEAGGTIITVRGTSLNIGSSHRVELGQLECTILDIKEDSIQCITPPSEGGAIETFSTLIEVFIDNWSGRDAGFNYRANPMFESIEPNISFVAGGTNYTVRGENLDTVQSPRLLFYLGESGQRRRRQTVQDEGEEWDAISEPCMIDSESGGTTMQCIAPSLDVNSSSTTVTIGLLMDGVTSLLQLNNTVTVHLNPTFTRFDGEREFDEDDEIVLTIEGSGYTFLPDQVMVRITPCRAAMCPCEVISINREENTLECEVPNAKDLERDVSLTVTVHLGNQTTEIGTIRIEQPVDFLLFILIPTFLIFLIFAGVIFMVVVAVFCRKTHQKDQRYDQLILELEKLESSVARECKLGFAELQTDLDELTGDVAGCRLPYRDLHSYMLANLFPGIKDHPIMHELDIPSHRKPLVERALRDFYEHHILDKKVLLVFIRTLEEQRNFTIHDKSIVGSLLMVTLHSKMDYATEVLKNLLAELIRRIVNQSHPKLLLRRTECVAERMLTNWLAFCLHGYIMEHGGQPMYLLYRAVKNQLEKGPIDVITGEARYSLSEQKLIRQKMDVETINATVETEDGLRIPVKVLDMDTISQAKEKLLDAVFKAAPTSQRPSLTSVELEYMRSPMEHLLLRDEDPSTIYEASWKRINTLRHYRVLDGAIFRLTPRRNHPPPGRTWDYPASLISTHCPRQRALSEAEDGTRVWHLFKQLDVEDPKRSPFLNKKMVTEIYLPRMLSTKSILQKFVDDLFVSLFSVSHPPSSPSTVYAGFFPHSPGIQVPMGYAPGADAVPMAVKYLFDFLDDEAENARIVDPDVVHTWKNNALSLRFWVNMIKNPEFVFDINKSHTVDACLSVIAQAYIDGCSSADVKLTIDSPTSKLLYNKEVQGYKAKVKKYYEEVQQLPRVPEDAMQYYLKQLSSYQTQLMRKSGGFVTMSALYEVLRYGIKYHEPFLLNLRAAGLESKAQMFEGVLRVAM